MNQIAKMSIQAIFYSEFDDNQGKIVLYHYPKDYNIDKLFSLSCDYIIPSQQLCGKVISINVIGKIILGCPMCINNDKEYERNAKIFNMCFLFDINEDIECYKPIIRKLNNVIKKVEIESGFIRDIDRKQTLPTIIQSIYFELNRKEECSVPISDSHFINLKVFRPLPPIPKVYITIFFK